MKTQTVAHRPVLPVAHSARIARQPRQGARIKPIEAIEVGDMVWAWDEVVGALVRRPVVRLFRHQGKPIIAVTVLGEDGAAQRIEATTEHPFWVEGKGWVAAAGRYPSAAQALPAGCQTGLKAQLLVTARIDFI